MPPPRPKTKLAFLLSAGLLAVVLILWPLSFVYPKGFSTQSLPNSYGVVSSAGEFGFIHRHHVRPATHRSELWQLRFLGIVYATDYVIVDATKGGTRTTLKIRWRTVAAFFLCTTAFLAWRFFRAPPPTPGFEVKPIADRQ